jgi:SAM-dependent methyltransferase
MTREADGASFKDPSGFVFQQNGAFYRQVNHAYREEYDLFLRSGLYGELSKRKLLVSHEEVTQKAPLPDEAYKILKPEQIPFISYPYEWSFGMLKDAAIKTLEIQELALQYGMSLKDASAYNIQYLDGNPILIDSLSFERYRENQPWVAYGQFCRHFLAPLALMAHVDIHLSALLKTYLDGIPVDIAARLLPKKTRFSLGLAIHIHAHAGTVSRNESRGIPPKRGSFSKTAMRALIDSLKTTVEKLSWKPADTPWADYYDKTNYSGSAFDAKKRLVRRFLDACDTRTVIDLGANDGTFSRIAAESGRFVISCDIDPAGVEKNYLQVKNGSEKNVLPLLIDVMNPSSSLGWLNGERRSFFERAARDSTVLALALVHHLAIGGNVPLPQVAKCFERLGKELIVEFVPKEDSQVQKMLSLRKDIFSEYCEEGFTAALKKYFVIEERSSVDSSIRVLFRSKRIT